MRFIKIYNIQVLVEQVLKVDNLTRGELTALCALWGVLNPIFGANALYRGGRERPKGLRVRGSTRGGVRGC